MNNVEDMLRAIRLVHDIGGNPNSAIASVIPGAPWSKSRPRFMRNGKTYTNPEDRKAEQRMAAHLGQMFQSPFDGNVAVVAIFYRPNRQRIDADNMLKHVCDSATGIAWHDDSQVTAIAGLIELDADNPRTVVVFTEHESSLGRGNQWKSTCVKCGTVFVVNPKNSARKYCSTTCSDTARGRRPVAPPKRPIPCAYCHNEFVPSRKQTFCSVTCARASSRGVPRPWQAKPYSSCASCDKTLTHRRGGLCRECWRESRKQAAAGSGAG